MNVLILGNSDGIGLRLTGDLLSKGYNVVGISKSAPKVNFAEYSNLSQHLLDVRGPDFKEAFSNIVCSIEHLDLCVFCIGIGEELNFSQLQSETTVFEVNLTLQRTFSINAATNYGPITSRKPMQRDVFFDAPGRPCDCVGCGSG